MKGKNLYAVLMACCIIIFWLFDEFYVRETYGSPKGEDRDPVSYGRLLPSSTTGTVIDHDHYSLSYHETYEQAEWVAYRIKKDHLSGEGRKRPYFVEDPKVWTKSADWRNYKSSGYDRGHLCAAGDMVFSASAHDQTFYTSNISPQKRDFNAGVWNRLEQRARYWAKKYDGVYVVTGGVLGHGLKEIGYEGVAVPNFFYKVIVKGQGDQIQVAAFLIPHQETKAPLEQFLVAVDSLEQLTGIDFFERLPDSLEKVLEKEIRAEGWQF
jgi:endonuclease G